MTLDLADNWPKAKAIMSSIVRKHTDAEQAHRSLNELTLLPEGSYIYAVEKTGEDGSVSWSIQVCFAKDTHPHMFEC